MYWTRDDARGTWDRTADWPPSQDALPAAELPLPPSESCSASAADEEDDDIIQEVLTPLSKHDAPPITPHHCCAVLCHAMFGDHDWMRYMATEACT